MVDAATLPDLPTNTTLETGQRFIIEGDNFNYWPNEIVLAYSEVNALEVAIDDQVNRRIFKLVDKTNNTLTFEVIEGYFFPAAHKWEYFAAPFALPRTLLNYSTL